MGDLHTVVVTRAQAKKRGMRNYFSGTVCPEGNVWYRSTAKSKCFCAACDKKTKDYYKSYYSDNRETIITKAKNYQKDNADWYKEYSESYRASHKKEASERSRQNYLENPDKFKEQRDRYYAENKEAERMRKKKCAEERKLRNVSWDEELTSFVEKEARELCKDREQLTGFKWSVDHMYPLVGKEVSGFHHWSNIQCIPSRLNQNKHNSMMYTEPFEWLKDCT